MSATGVVTLYPATVHVSLSLPPEMAVTYLSTSLNPLGAGQPSSKGANVSSPGPYTIDVIVDGGDPADPADTGFTYRASLSASISNGSGSSSSLSIYKNNAIHVDNTPDHPSVTVSAPFNYPDFHRVNGTLTVTGGTISAYRIYTSTNNSTANESYYANAYFGGNNRTVVTGSLATVAHSSVTVYGYADVVDSSGTSVSRSLASQVVDLSAGDVDMSWTVDLPPPVPPSPPGRLLGNVSLSPTGEALTPSSVYVDYSGPSYGSLLLPSSQSSYSFSLKPGTYYVRVSYSINSTSQSWSSPSTPVTITSGEDTAKDFAYTLGAGRLKLDFKGFYDSSKISYLSTGLDSTSNQGSAGAPLQPGVSFASYTLPVGDWRPTSRYVQVNDSSKPEFPSSNAIHLYHYNEPELTIRTVTAGTTADLGTENVTLMRSNIYFDVVEPEGQPQLPITNPQISASQYDYNPDHRLRRYSYMNSYGSSTPRALSGLTMVAEPGVYQIGAYATVNGTSTRFRGTQITFGEPIGTPSGSGVETVLTPASNSSLQVTLGFDTVSNGGISTVVETPLGPAPPEGFQVACGASGACDPVYYDISSTAQWSGETEVCIRRQFTGVSERAGTLLQLLHYNELLRAWEELPPSTGGVSSFNRIRPGGDAWRAVRA